MPSFTSKSINADEVINNFIINVLNQKKREKYLSEALSFKGLVSHFMTKEKNQDSNTSSNVSTVSDDDRKTTTSNSNNGDNNNLNALIKKEIRKMNNYFNKTDVFMTDPSLACQYYCNMTNEDGDERFVSYQKSKLDYFVNGFKRFDKKCII